MNLFELVQPEKPFTLEIQHPVNGAPTGIFFKLVSHDSDVVQAQIKKHGQLALDRTEKGIKLTTEHMEDQLLDEAAAMVVGWEWGSNGYYADGTVPEFTFENVREMLSKQSWLYEQVRKAAANRANFTKA